MSSKLSLAKILKLVEQDNPVLAQSVAATVKDAGLSIEEAYVKRARTSRDVPDLEEGSRTAIQYASTRTLDRDGEILIPKGVVLTDFRKAPSVLWGHDYSEPPIGSDKSVLVDDFGVLATTQYASTARAKEVFTLKQEGHLRTQSVGFIPLKAVSRNEDGFDKLVESLKSQDATLHSQSDRLARIFTKWLMFEHSDVSVASNTDAVQIAVSKGGNDWMRKFFPDLSFDPPEYKRVIGFSVHGDGPRQDIKTPWDGPIQRRAADTEDLMIMSTWFDAEEPDVKGSYKLHHHAASGSHAVNFRGVVAAMGALFGARGGVNIPGADRKGVWNHLARHYRQFDREPPEFRAWTEADLKLFHEEQEPDTHSVEVVSVPSYVEVVKLPQKFDVQEAQKQAMNFAVDMVTGKV